MVLEVARELIFRTQEFLFSLWPTYLWNVHQGFIKDEQWDVVEVVCTTCGCLAFKGGGLWKFGRKNADDALEKTLAKSR